MSEQEYDTTDKNITLLLLTAGLPILKTTKDGSNKTVFFFSKELAEPWIDKYQKNHSIMFEYSDYTRALGLFNSIVHSR
jgi:hypothetical protein